MKIFVCYAACLCLFQLAVMCLTTVSSMLRTSSSILKLKLKLNAPSSVVCFKLVLLLVANWQILLDLARKVARDNVEP